MRCLCTYRRYLPNFPAAFASTEQRDKVDRPRRPATSGLDCWTLLESLVLTTAENLSSLLRFCRSYAIVNFAAAASLYSNI